MAVNRLFNMIPQPVIDNRVDNKERAKLVRPMSESDQQRTSQRHLTWSALPPKADIRDWHRYVRFVPKADSCSAACLGRSLFEKSGRRGLFLSSRLQN